MLKLYYKKTKKLYDYIAFERTKGHFGLGVTFAWSTKKRSVSKDNSYYWFIMNLGWFRFIIERWRNGSN